MLAGASSCVDEVLSSQRRYSSSGLLVVGIFGYFGFRVWEAVDVWYGGYRQMEDYEYLEKKIRKHETKKVSFFLLPELDKNKAGLRFGLTF